MLFATLDEHLMHPCVIKVGENWEKCTEIHACSLFMYYLLSNVLDFLSDVGLCGALWDICFSHLVLCTLCLSCNVCVLANKIEQKVDLHGPLSLAEIQWEAPIYLFCEQVKVGESFSPISGSKYSKFHQTFLPSVASVSRQGLAVKLRSHQRFRLLTSVASWGLI